MASLKKPFSLEARIESLQTQWEKGTAEFLQRQVFKDQPELVAEAEKIRDVYTQLFAWRQPLVRQKENLHKRGLPLEEQALVRDTLSSQINNLDYHLIAHSNSTFLRLQSGSLSLSPGDAKTTIGKLIKFTLDAFETACRRDALVRPQVPHVPLETPAESVRKLILVPQTIDPS